MRLRRIDARHHLAGRRTGRPLDAQARRDRADPLRYVTIDRWASIEDWRAFRARFAAEYERLDHASETLTAREAPLGEYTTPAGAMTR